ncbi:MAG: TIGR03960 family B12-binding radical SAM protein [Schwartzia sp.]|nr:TIGR03960 family B12-binding radical SAM protein [Schwartzia sp. (in: firmicutes)]
MNWKLKEALAARLAREKGYYLHPAGGRTRFALAYPNSYYVGMSNLGFHIVYDVLNRRADTACERFFLPERREFDEYERTRTPLLSMETQTPLSEFAIVGFAVSFEMDYFHLLEMLETGRVPLLAAERDEKAPFVIAGGPCATFNPEPLSPFVDAFIIGEGEETVGRFMDAYHAAKDAGATREETLRLLSRVPGVYVPSLYEHIYNDSGELEEIRPIGDTPTRVERQWVKNLDDYPAHTVVVTDETEFDMYLVETARGCGRHCRFCMAGYCFRRPRNRSLSVLKDAVKAAKVYEKRIGLMGAAISDHPEIDALSEYILSENMTMSVASFRADSVTETLVRSLAESGMKTITLAPEAGSVKMRAVVNKGIEEEHLFHVMDLGMAAGIRHYRLYIMIGLPQETEEDVDAIAELTERLKDYLERHDSRSTLKLSVNPFIPKPFTPFQWTAMADKKYIEAALKRLKKSLSSRKGVELIAEPSKSAYIQAVLARGDRRVGAALYRAHEMGGAKAFLRAMKAEGLEEAYYIFREYGAQDVLPWDVLDMGVKKEYLYAEWKRAERLETTIPCFDGCRRCGVCGD